MKIKVLKYFLRDVLGIELEMIYSIRFRDPFMKRRRRLQKLGILDIVLELNDDTKVDIELQVRYVTNWDKRQLFYLSRLYSEDLRKGQDYSCLKRCIGISILDFNRDDSPEYHRVYRLRDGKGSEYSDLLELHVLELNKVLTGQGDIDDWIRFFNAETEEDLDMIKAKTENPGILEAIEELRRMSMSNPIRLLYEDHLKRVRDQRARDDYMLQKGHEEGGNYKLVALVCKKLRKGKSPEVIAEDLEEELTTIQLICEQAAGFAPNYDTDAVFKAVLKDGGVSVKKLK